MFDTVLYIMVLLMVVRSRSIFFPEASVTISTLLSDCETAVLSPQAQAAPQRMQSKAITAAFLIFFPS